MKSFRELLESRESCRAYSGKAVSAKEIKEIISDALLSPSARNSQPWSFIGVPGDSEKFAETVLCTQVNGRNTFTSKAGGFIIILCEEIELGLKFPGKPRKFEEIDTGICTGIIALSAVSYGISDCILGMFDDEKLRTLLNIPEGKTPKLVIALGYPESTALREKTRKPIEEKLTIE